MDEGELDGLTMGSSRMAAKCFATLEAKEDVDTH